MPSAIINPVSKEQHAKIVARLREGELNPNNKNRNVCAREYLLSAKKRIQKRCDVYAEMLSV